MGDLHSIEGAGSRAVPGMGLARTRAASGQAEETWVLQSEAAARTGFSVSAIRKWRRMGLVAERKVTSATGLERVEVKLQDVLARAALQPDRRPPPTTDVDIPATPGSVVIAVTDLEGLFQRMVEAERRADVAEAELQSVQARARFTFGQLAELRRQLQAPLTPAAPLLRSRDPLPLPEPHVESWPAPRPRPAAPPPPSPPPPPERTRPRVPQPPVPALRAASPPPRPPPPAARRLEPPAVIAAPRARPSPAPEGTVEDMFGRLQRIYGRLDEYRREPAISPATERQRQRELSDYDRVLVAVCEAIDIPTGPAGGQPLSVENRAAFTRALARAGLDVRSPGYPGAPLRGRFRRPGARPH